MKSDLIFALENAAWPAFLVNNSGKISRCSEGARSLFGPNAAPNALLSSLWGKENSDSTNQFLSKLGGGADVHPKIWLKLTDGTTSAFETWICSFQLESETQFLIQLKLATRGAAGPAREETAFRNKGETQPLEAAAAHKQKLECALQLTRTVALDFNNALTSILGHTSLILSKMEVGHPWRNSLVEVEKSAGKAAEIAHDLAAFSRQEKDAKSQQAGNLNQLVDRTVSLFKASQPPTLSWQVTLESRVFTVPFDEAKMQQAFLKILENAVQAVNPQGRIGVRTSNLEVVGSYQDENVTLQPGAYVCVEFTDNGKGIPAEVLPRIFEPFFTTKNSPGHRGLGLAWVYGIVTNHGGSVAVSSATGAGTSVRVYLPALKKFVRQNNISPDDLTGTQTILIIDDEDLLLTMGEMILSSYGYTVLTAASGQKALEIFESRMGEIDLVITDLVMPQMSGRELMERLRALEPGIRIVCASGYMRSGTSVEEDESYLQKPFTSQDLLQKVKQALAN